MAIKELAVRKVVGKGSYMETVPGAIFLYPHYYAHVFSSILRLACTYALSKWGEGGTNGAFVSSRERVSAHLRSSSASHSFAPPFPTTLYDFHQQDRSNYNWIIKAFLADQGKWYFPQPTKKPSVLIQTFNSNGKDNSNKNYFFHIGGSHGVISY